MPLGGGVAGVHSDSMHQGSAKRDVADGVAGLGAGGELLAPGSEVVLTRDGSEFVEILERTSGEIITRWTRAGVDDYEQDIHCAGLVCRMQHSGMKDVADGIAALDGSGDLLVPGSELHLTRTGAGWTFIKERTSDEVILQFKRWGVEDYTPSVLSSGAPSPIQLANMKNVANGIAGLDANVLLDPFVHLVGLEEYANHLGAVDNFTQSGTAGNGAATTVVANHHMNLSTGLTVNGHALYESKSDFTLSSKPIVLNFLIQNIVNGVAGSRVTYFGLMQDFTVLGVLNGVYFAHSSGDVWSCYSESAGIITYTDIASVSNGDLCTIVATASEIRFFVNSALVFTITTNIPTVAMEFGAVVHEYGAGATTAREIAIDMMSMRRNV